MIFKLFVEKMSRSPFKIYWLASILLLVLVFGLMLRFCFDCSWLVLYFMSINIVIGLMYLWDKIISPWNLMRVPELVLHSLALLGGSPTALISQKLFRHKSNKKSFILVYWLVVLVQIMFIFFLLKKN